MRFSSILTGALAAALVSAHPGHDATQEQAVRRAYLQNSKKDLSHCAAKIKARGLEARNIKRRENLANKLIEKRGLSLKNGTEILLRLA